MYVSVDGVLAEGSEVCEIKLTVKYLATVNDSGA